MSSPIVPSDAFIEKLIYEVRQRPYLYDAKDPHYPTVSIRKQGWTEIAAILDESVDVVKSRWHNLRCRYVKDRQRLIQRGGKPTYTYYKELDFLCSCVGETRRYSSDPEAKKHMKDEVSERNGDDAVYSDQAEPSARNSYCIDNAEVSNSNLDGNHFNFPLGLCEVMNSHADGDSEVPAKRPREEPSSTSTTSEKESALLKGIDALVRIADRGIVRESGVSKDSDECFVEYVLSVLREIDSGSRTHARIAILQALAQYQS